MIRPPDVKGRPAGSQPAGGPDAQSANITANSITRNRQLALVDVLISTLPPRIAARITIDPESGCWITGGHRDKDGYARLGDRGLHRVVYELLVGPIPPGLVIDHVLTRGCVSRACVNAVAHLEPITLGENTLRGNSFAAVNARKTHCGACGTPYDERNTYHAPDGRRGCRACNCRAVGRYKKRLREERQQAESARAA